LLSIAPFHEIGFSILFSPVRYKAHTLYSLDDNYLNVTLPAFASLLPVPQRYYVPGRIRESYRPRLEAAGLWRLAGEEERQELGESSSRRTGFFGTRKEKVLDEKTIYKKTFERNRVGHPHDLFGKTDSCMLPGPRESTLYFPAIRATPLRQGILLPQPVSPLLLQRALCTHPAGIWSPTPPDILLASHVLLLTAPPFPDRILRDLLTNEFPSLTAHAARVYAHAALATIPHVSSPATSAGRALRSLLPRHLPLRRSSRGGSTKRVAKKERSPEEVRFDRMRWGWIALTLTALAVFVRTGGIGVTLSSVPPGEEDMYSEFGPGDDDDERPVEVDDYDH
jgi:sorting and assembly machinery component 37